MATSSRQSRPAPAEPERVVARGAGQRRDVRAVADLVDRRRVRAPASSSWSTDGDDLARRARDGPPSMPVSMTATIAPSPRVDVPGGGQALRARPTTAAACRAGRRATARACEGRVVGHVAQLGARSSCDRARRRAARAARGRARRASGPPAGRTVTQADLRHLRAVARGHRAPRARRDDGTRGRGGAPRSLRSSSVTSRRAGAASPRARRGRGQREQRGSQPRAAARRAADRCA